MYAKVDWKDYFGKDAQPSIKEYIVNNRNTIYPWLYDTMKFSIEKKLEEVAILRFQDTKIYATIQSKDFTNFLEVILQYYVSVEEYEICAEIRDLIADMKVKELLATKPKRTRAKKQSVPKLIGVK